MYHNYANSPNIYHFYLEYRDDDADDVTDDLGFEPLTMELLRSDKQFVKSVKKQQKDVEVTRKRHAKDRSALQRQHCIVFDKVVAVQEREKTQQAKIVERASKSKR